MRVLITTSHRPSVKLRVFIKELAQAIPNSIRINRGKKTLQDLYLEALNVNADRLIIAGDFKGNPSTLTLYTVSKGFIKPKTLAHIILGGTKLLREIKDHVRIYNPSTLGIDITGMVKNDEVLKLTEVLSKGLHGKFVLKPEDYKKYDVIIEIQSAVDSLCKLLFIEPRTGRVGGPILKVLKVHYFER